MRCTVLALVAVLPGVALADVVILKDGERVEGIVEERGGQVAVRLDFGTITFEKSEIDRVEKGSTALATFEARHAALGARDVEGRYRLGLEAEKRGLDGFARGLYREVIELSIDHKGARAALGFRRHDSAWLTEDDYMVGQGYVRHGGAWITRDAAIALERAETERRVAEAEVLVRRAEVARIERLEADVAAARADAAAARAGSGEGSEPAALGYPVWVPYWNGARWDHRKAPAAGLNVTISGSGGRIQLGGTVGNTPRAPTLPRAAAPARSR